MDQDRVLEVVEGRTEEAAKSLLNTLSDNQKETIDAAAMDMWNPFINV